jgi:hypothetical protein
MMGSGQDRQQPHDPQMDGCRPLRRFKRVAVVRVAIKLEALTFCAARLRTYAAARQLFDKEFGALEFE